MSNTSIQQFFPFVPDGMEWEDWNGNFIMYYGEENISYNIEENWQNTAKNIAQSSTFSVYPIPDPDMFENWQDWAREVTLIINGPSY